MNRSGAYLEARTHELQREPDAADLLSTRSLDGSLVLDTRNLDSVNGLEHAGLCVGPVGGLNLGGGDAVSSLLRVGVRDLDRVVEDCAHLAPSELLNDGHAVGGRVATYKLAKEGVSDDEPARRKDEEQVSRLSPAAEQAPKGGLTG